MNSRTILDIGTEISLLGVASADVVLTGGGGDGPFKFTLENVVERPHLAGSGAMRLNHREEKFMLTRTERAKIAKEFPEHLVRMRNCLEAVGRPASDSDVTLAWARYSDSLCASWLEPPSSDTALTEILLSYLPEASSPTEEAFRAILEEAEDEVGDAVVALPPDLLDRLGWKTGDTLSISEDSQGGITLRRV